MEESMKHTLIFGHKIPDTDSVCAAITLSNLKNELNESSKPYILSEINRETQFVLDYFDVEKPKLLKNVKLQINDLNYDKIEPYKPEYPIFYAYHYMHEKNLRTLPVTDDDNKLVGIITMKDIAMNLINIEQKTLTTSYDNIINTLDARPITKFDEIIEGEIVVTAFYYETLKNKNVLDSSSIVIVGDRYDVVELAIENKVRLIIVTGDLSIPERLIDYAKENKVNLIISPYKTYYTAKNISLSKPVNEIMTKTHLIKFYEDTYLEDIREELENTRHSKFPIITKDNTYLGIMGRTHLLNPSKKRVILVDHNEYGQSSDGLEEAEIAEIIDHHKIGDISTSLPISFRNIPVGSTNTIIYYMYKENNINIDRKIAGLMISGILSDTLMLKSPTTTKKDTDAVNDLVRFLDISIEEYCMLMFRAGTSIVGKTVEDVLYQDFKRFDVSSKKIGVSQVFTLSIEEIMNNKDEYIKYIDSITDVRGYYLNIMAVTDIINEGSYMFYTSEREKLIKNIFELKEVYQGVFIPKCVSRKKQIVPSIINALHRI
jgi:manganese-dependent inorganic pyrophosphatase